MEDLKSNMGMLFIADDLRARHLPKWVRKSEQTTDGYLLALAKSHTASVGSVQRRLDFLSRLIVVSPRSDRRPNRLQK